MWYDTMCSDDPSTIIIRTEGLDRISEFSLPSGAADGSVMIEAGVTFFQLAEYLHQNKASMGYTLVRMTFLLDLDNYSWGEHDLLSMACSISN